MGVSAPQVNVMGISETLNAACNFANLLAAGEVISGTPTLADASSELTVASSDIAISSSAMIVNGTSAAIGQVVTFLVTASTVIGRYDLDITADSDSNQKFVRQLGVIVEVSS